MCADTLTDERQCGAGTRTLGKSTRFFCSHLKISEMAGERVFLLSLSSSSFFWGLLLFQTIFFPRNVHKIKEFKCFSALIISIIQHHPTGLGRKGESNALNVILVSSLSFSLLSCKNQSRLENTSLAFLTHWCPPPGWAVAHGLMDQVLQHKTSNQRLRI